PQLPIARHASLCTFTRVRPIPRRLDHKSHPSRRLQGCHPVLSVAALCCINLARTSFSGDATEDAKAAPDKGPKGRGPDAKTTYCPGKVSKGAYTWIWPPYSGSDHFCHGG